MTDTNPEEGPVTVVTTTSTAVERHIDTGIRAVALNDEHYLARIPQMAEQLAKSSMCPEPFRNKPEDIAVIGYGLADNGIRLSISTLPQCYVVKGKPGYMAQIQTAMAALHGIDLHPIDRLCNDESATVEMIMPNGKRYEVTFTMAAAKKAKLDQNPGNQYQLRPENMLIARAMTRAIDRHAPAVKLGLAGSINMEDLGAVGVLSPVASSEEETGEMVTIPSGKKLVLDAIVALHSIGTEQAAPMASLLWSSHRLPSGQGMVARSQVDALLATLPSPVPDGSPSPESPSVPDGGSQGPEPSARTTAGSPSSAVAEQANSEPEQTAIEYGPDEEPFD